jgi:cyclic-di-AMP phosphodiesterase PgpH
MIADSVEAASRAMPSPTSDELEVLVQRMVNVVFSEGQLDECDLSLRDLNVLARSFLHTLVGIYHARPEYPAGAQGPRPQQLGLTSVVTEARRAGGTPPPRR